MSAIATAKVYAFPFSVSRERSFRLERNVAIYPPNIPVEVLSGSPVFDKLYCLAIWYPGTETMYRLASTIEEAREMIDSWSPAPSKPREVVIGQGPAVSRQW